MKAIETLLEGLIFNSRWLLAPFYLGLVIGIVMLLVKFGQELIHTVPNIMTLSESEVVLAVLALVDLSLVANLLLIVIFSGYENFVSRIDVATTSTDRPHWMGTIDFSGLKIKLIGSLVAISVIELLKDFIELSGQEHVGAGTKWRIVIHLTFVASGVLFALMDWIADKREFHGTHA